MSLSCPKCEAESPLKAVVIDAVEVDQCLACEGIWFDKAELGNLLNSDTGKVSAILGGADDDAHDHKRASCPRDDKGLLRVKSARNSEVTIDACAVCQGVWLDGGEFRRIKQAQPGVRLGELV